MTTRFETLINQTALKKALHEAFGKDWFDVSGIGDILDILDRQDKKRTPEYQLLRRVHCVNWKDMPPELPAMIKAKFYELTGLHAMVVLEDCDNVFDVEAREIKPYTFDFAETRRLSA